RLLTIRKSYISPKQYEQNLSGQGNRKFTHLCKCRFLTFSASPKYSWIPVIQKRTKSSSKTGR
ncbi:hypothetical protein, partial [Microcoleus sp. bin38.metabat.b11b12b14.051]|uniref:hypothetical protein n=1 Tax=Microcoleus sp. bin38.metabat.b11b12b14.051 TaxID=2742709 RepID=UPI0025DB2CAE